VCHYLLCATTYCGALLQSAMQVIESNLSMPVVRELCPARARVSRRLGYASSALALCLCPSRVVLEIVVVGIVGSTGANPKNS
jgi:hypothetical protein